VSFDVSQDDNNDYYPGIQEAVDALLEQYPSLPGNACVVIRDTATYAEGLRSRASRTTATASRSCPTRAL